MTEKRPAWDGILQPKALITNRSTCKRAKVGAILVRDNKGDFLVVDQCQEPSIVLITVSLIY